MGGMPSAGEGGLLWGRQRVGQATAAPASAVSGPADLPLAHSGSSFCSDPKGLWTFRGSTAAPRARVQVGPAASSRGHLWRQFCLVQPVLGAGPEVAAWLAAQPVPSEDQPSASWRAAALGRLGRSSRSRRVRPRGAGPAHRAGEPPGLLRESAGGGGAGRQAAADAPPPADLGNRLTELNKSVLRLHSEMKRLRHTVASNGPAAAPLDGASVLHKYIMKVRSSFQSFDPDSGSSGQGSPPEVVVHQGEGEPPAPAGEDEPPAPAACPEGEGEAEAAECAEESAPECAEESAPAAEPEAEPEA